MSEDAKKFMRFSDIDNESNEILESGSNSTRKEFNLK